jgi:hypothetical protein
LLNIEVDCISTKKEEKKNLPIIPSKTENEGREKVPSDSQAADELVSE